jgi:hypothetical protein
MAFARRKPMARALVVWCALLLQAGAAAAAPDAPPRVLLCAAPAAKNGLQQYDLEMKLTAADGTEKALRLKVNLNGADGVRDYVFNQATRLGWVAEKAGKYTLVVKGTRGEDGRLVPVAKCALALTNVASGGASLVGVSGAAVKTAAPEPAAPGKPEPAAAVPPPPAGPCAAAPVPADPPKEFIEFDLSSLPEEVGRAWSVSLAVATTQDKGGYADRVGPVGGYLERLGLCDAVVAGLTDRGFRAEVLDGAKVRVYGRTHDGKFYPVVRGTVASDELKKEELPAVRQPKG